MDERLWLADRFGAVAFAGARCVAKEQANSVLGAIGAAGRLWRNARRPEGILAFAVNSSKPDMIIFLFKVGALPPDEIIRRATSAKEMRWQTSATKKTEFSECVLHRQENGI